MEIFFYAWKIVLMILMTSKKFFRIQLLSLSKYNYIFFRFAVIATTIYVLYFIFKGLFNGLSITSIQEAMLGGNEWKKDSQRLVWTDTTSNNELLGEIDANLTITLSPMQIRTFILTLISEN